RLMSEANAASTEGFIRVVDGVPSGTLSPGKYEQRVLYDVLTPMRDGIELAMDVALPDAAGPFPTFLVRTHCNKRSFRRTHQLIAELVRRGYAVAVQDSRGRFNSRGNFDPYRQEPNDGFDTIEWLARQAWCDGHVGMIGGSYTAQSEWLAASQAPKALKAI